MQVVSLTDHQELDRARSFLLGNEARHILMLGLMATPELFEDFRMWAVVEGEEEEPLAVALMTPPHNIVVSRPAVPAAISALANGLAEEGVALPGVVGAVPEVEAFVEAWREVTGTRAALEMSQRLHRLSSVRDLGVSPPGALRRVTPRDRDLVVDWLLAFSAEALSEDQAPEEAGRFVDARLAAENAGFFLWDDDGIVSLVGYGGFTPTGARIGPVYTPLEFRGRGYGTALTAAVSAWLLREGRRSCFLYTDLANPTSNAIYRRIGYESVCDSAMYRFDPVG